MLEISRCFSIPENTDVFEIKDNYIALTKKGYYVFTISGILQEENKNGSTTFILRTQHQSNYNNSINIRLENYAKRKYFVSKKIQRFSYLQDISLRLNKTDISDANVQDAILIIQKLV